MRTTTRTVRIVMVNVDTGFTCEDDRNRRVYRWVDGREFVVLPNRDGLRRRFALDDPQTVFITYRRRP